MAWARGPPVVGSKPAEPKPSAAAKFASPLDQALSAAAQNGSVQQASAQPASQDAAASTATAAATPDKTSVPNTGSLRGLTTLVLDAGAFIGGNFYQLANPAVRYVTTRAVIAELKGQNTRDLLASFPFTIETLDVSPDALAFAHKFATATGDASVLSVQDLQVIALAYQMEVAAHGKTNIRSEPQRITLESGAAKKQPQSQPQSQEQQPQEQSLSSSSSSSAESSAQPNKPELSSASPDTSASAAPEAQQQEVNNAVPSSTQPLENTTPTQPQAQAQKSQQEEEQGEEEEEEEEEEEDDEATGGAWINPANVFQDEHPMIAADAARSAGRGPPKEQSTVACITTDFAVQNVLLQMGCRLFSVNGMAVRQLRQWLNKCYGCNWLCRDMERQFCEKCGHHTMVRVSVTVDSSGQVKQWFSHRAVFNLRGTRYPIPLPKGGRHNTDIKLAEDAMNIKKPNEKRLLKMALAKSEQFADACEFGLRKSGPGGDGSQYGYGRRNINEVKRRTGNKKR